MKLNDTQEATQLASTKDQHDDGDGHSVDSDEKRGEPAEDIA